MESGPSRRWLSRAVVGWFVVGVAGQMLFALSVAAFYGLAASRGHWQSWNRFMTQGYVPDEAIGNGAVALHLLAATLVVVSGALSRPIRRRATCTTAWARRWPRAATWREPWRATGAPSSSTRRTAAPRRRWRSSRLADQAEAARFAIGVRSSSFTVR